MFLPHTKTTTTKVTKNNKQMKIAPGELWNATKNLQQPSETQNPRMTAQKSRESIFTWITPSSSLAQLGAQRDPSSMTFPREEEEIRRAPAALVSAADTQKVSPLKTPTVFAYARVKGAKGVSGAPLFQKPASSLSSKASSGRGSSPAPGTSSH